MNIKQITRPRYSSGQFLRTQDFTDAQAYHVAMHRRHNIAQHTWGIVNGLKLAVEADGVLYVQAGVAVDGFGRDLILVNRQEVPQEAFTQRNTRELDVWLTYGRIGSDPAPAGYYACDKDAEDRPLYRWIERPQVLFTIPDPGFTDRRRPASLTEAELEFNATQVPPDSTDEDWPVFIGLARLTPEGFEVNDLGRPYAGLVGEKIESASRLPDTSASAADAGKPMASVLLGTDASALEVDRRFSVHVPEADQRQKGRHPQDDTVIAVDKDGAIDLLGRTTVHGDLRIDGGSLSFPGPTAEASPATEAPDATESGSVPVPTSAQPWRIYRTRIPQSELTPDDVAGPPVLEADQPLPGDELRIEMQSSGSLHAPNRVVIGSWSAKEKKFKPCLTVREDCTVIVSGDLIVEGVVHKQPLGETQLDAEAVMLRNSALGGGVVGSNVLIGRRIQPTLRNIGEVFTIARVEAGMPTLEDLASGLTGREGEFVTLLKDLDIDAATKLWNALGGENGPGGT